MTAPTSTVDLRGLKATVHLGRNPGSHVVVLTTSVRVDQTARHAVGYLLYADGDVASVGSSQMRASGHRALGKPGGVWRLPFSLSLVTDSLEALPAGRHHLVVAIKVSPWSASEGPNGHWVTPPTRVIVGTTVEVS